MLLAFVHSRPRNALFGIKGTGTEKQGGGEIKKIRRQHHNFFLKET